MSSKSIVSNSKVSKSTTPTTNNNVEVKKQHSIYKLVLTGGPCGGKTTAQERLAVFFENLGWKVYRPPETATLLFRGGIRFNELNERQIEDFQNDLLMTLIQIENVYLRLAAGAANGQNCLLVFDRGTMDGSSYIDPKMWERILQRNSLNAIDLRDNRYDQVIHMVTAADGAPDFYTIENNRTRTEDLKQAIEQDKKTRHAWLGHPYLDVIDNSGSRSFEEKILQLVQRVCDRMNVHYGDRLAPNSKKRKFLVTSFDESRFPKYEEFRVIHRFLRSDEKDVQGRIRKRGQNGKWAYTYTTRRQNAKGEKIETRMQISPKEFLALYNHADPNRSRTYKKRRCFIWEQQYYQLDIYCRPLPDNFNQLIILETYTVNDKKDIRLPDFLKISKEITGDPEYSLLTLSRKRRDSLSRPNDDTFN